jgi:hypothetical protein
MFTIRIGLEIKLIHKNEDENEINMNEINMNEINMNEIKMNELRSNLHKSNRSNNFILKPKNNRSKGSKGSINEIFDLNSIPKEIVEYIGEFINSKEIIAEERINKINAKQTQMIKRSPDEWIEWFMKHPHMYNINFIHVSKREIMIDTYNWNFRLEQKSELLDLMIYDETWNKNLFDSPKNIIKKIILHSKPSPRYHGQTFVDMKGQKFQAIYVVDKHFNHFGLFRLMRKGCKKYTLKWFQM